MKIFYTSSALYDLRRLRKFIEQENPKAATKAAKRIYEAIQRLLDFPKMGKKIEDHQETTVRELITGKYIIRYLIIKKELHILRIWHGKEDRGA